MDQKCEPKDPNPNAFWLCISTEQRTPTRGQICIQEYCTFILAVGNRVRDAKTTSGGLGVRPRLLLVDDDQRILGCFTAILEAADFEMRAVNSARAAKFALRQHEFDLVITDMAMEMPTAGFEVARAAREQPYQPEVVILTAFPVPSCEWQQSGATALFVKGGQTPDCLIAKIKAILDDSVNSLVSA